MMKKKMIVYLFIGLGLMGLFLLAPDIVNAAGTSGVTEADHIYEIEDLRKNMDGINRFITSDGPIIRWFGFIF